MKQILFIDDEPGRIEDYWIFVDIKLGFNTMVEDRSLSLIYDDLGSGYISPDIIILDIMYSNVLTNKYTGLEGGVKFYKDLKKDLKLKVPVIILTNRKKENMPEFVKYVESFNDYFLEKIKTRPSNLVEIITIIASQT